MEKIKVLGVNIEYNSANVRILEPQNIYGIDIRNFQN